MSIAVGRSVFKLGEESRGNRSAEVIESGDSYDMDFDTFTTYTDQSVRFPYEIE